MARGNGHPAPHSTGQLPGKHIDCPVHSDETQGLAHPALDFHRSATSPSSISRKATVFPHRARIEQRAFLKTMPTAAASRTARFSLISVTSFAGTWM